MIGPEKFGVACAWQPLADSARRAEGAAADGSESAAA